MVSRGNHVFTCEIYG